MLLFRLEAAEKMSKSGAKMSNETLQQAQTNGISIESSWSANCIIVSGPSLVTDHGTVGTVGTL